MIQLLAGDCRDILPTLAADSVQCVVTSPPYWNLRDYGTALWDGGDAACSHVNGALVSAKSKLRLDGREHIGPYDGEKAVTAGMPFRDTCGKCGARRIDRQIGLEATPDEYLATMVGVFREVRRVLRPDGTCWVNMGDSYASSASGAVGATSVITGLGTINAATARPDKSHAGKPKDLLMMPARLALALQAHGWWLRSDIIWHKPNPMPESVTDRCTSAHEHVFMLTKSPRYYFDSAAIREEAEYGLSHGMNWKRAREADPRDKRCDAAVTNIPGNGGSRSCRNVWTIATHAYPQAHFATYPPELAERCIRAGTSERGACSQCGAPWGRVTERYPGVVASPSSGYGNGAGRNDGGRSHVVGAGATTTGWAASCRCGATETRPCVVLDPFAGAGTTLLVADRLQRDAIGIELSPDYTRMAMQRCQDDAPLFTSFPPASDDRYDSGMRDLFRDAAD